MTGFFAQRGVSGDIASLSDKAQSIHTVPGCLCFLGEAVARAAGVARVNMV